MKISGNIVDVNNEPLQLTNITITTGKLANKMGTVANAKGDFELEDDLIDANSQFKISYQGFKSQFFKTKDLQDKKIKLVEDANVLEDVVFSFTKPAKKTINNVKENFNQHKMIYAGLGGILGLILVVTYFKNK